MLAGLVLAPLALGVVTRIKAFLSGRRGPPLFQPYREIAKLLRRGAVTSETTSWVFPMGPVLNLAAMIAALAMTPLGGVPAPLAFAGDLVLLAGLLALGRFATMIAALDTGSSFEGMGASREAFFAALAEPALFLALAALVRVTGETSLSHVYGAMTPGLWAGAAPAIGLAAATLMVVFLVENARMPVDDPTTHLELTMIHEVMVLDTSGPDLGLVHYAAALKLWVLGLLLAGALVPVRTGNPWFDAAGVLAGLLALWIVLGVLESVLARLRLRHVPELIVASGALAVVAFVLTLG